MADLAIGISKEAIQSLTNKVKSAMKEEAEQWQIVQRDLVFITGEFQMMESFLNMAGREHVMNDVVRTWVTQVRDLFYDVEDCIEYILHLDTSKWSFWLRLLRSFSCSCRVEQSALPVDEAVTEIRLLKARVEDVSERKLRYKFIRDSASNSLTQQQLMSGSAIGIPGFDILVEARDTASRCRGIVDLAKLVTGKSYDLRVISVWGTGDDLGTMSIMRNMYDDSRTHKNFRCRAWVKVTHPVNPPELIRSMVVQFFANSYPEQGETASCIDSQTWLCRLKLKKKRDALSWTETSAGDIVQEFVKLINTHRYLIILEDLSTVVQWDAIRPYLLNRNNGSRIVVSTPHHEIASLCTGKPYRVSELQRFSSNQSICVFFVAGLEDTEGGARVDISPTQESVLIGRDSEVEKLFSLIKDRPYTDKPHVVSVWGLPGSGRTAVVTNVYNRCKPDFLWCRTVNMSQPYNLMGFCQSLLSGFRSETLQADNPIEQCRELLHTVRVLVVIDEVRSKEEWDLIKAAELISAKSKSCVVVITTEESVAMHCASEVDLVCSIRCLQPMAAFDLFQKEYQKESSQNDRNSFEGHAFRRQRNSFEKLAFDYIFQPSASQNSEEVFQNNGNTSQEQALAYQSPENTVAEQGFRNNGNSSGKQALQNGNSFEEQAIQNNESSCSSGNTIKELPFQYNGNSVNKQAFQRDGNLFEAQTSQSNEKSFEEQSSQNSGNLFEEQKFRNNGNSSFEEVFCSLFETNRQEEHALENNGITFEEPAFQNGENLFEVQAFENSENSFEEQTFENSGDIFEVQSFPNNRNLLQEKEVQIEINKIRHLSISPNDPNVKAILSRSGGFPQLIVALGRYLATQHISNAGTREWQCQRLIGNFMQELQTNPEFYSLRGLLAWMHSYISFSPPSQIRCMFYLLIFPRQQTFQRRRLVRRWIAEGYGKDTGSNSLDESANDIFDKLTSQNVMQQATPAGVEKLETRTRYEVNGFFHEYMISRSRPIEERIFFPLEVSVLHEGHRRVNTQGVGQHLAIWRSWERNRVVFESLDFSGLRSLTVIGRWEPFLISDKMRVLRVLDLEDACEVTNEDLERIVKVLTRLKFLSLRGCTKITRVPDYLGGLRQLQTLDIRGTSVASLRFSITKLSKLQYLRAGTTDDHTSCRSPSSTTEAPSLPTPSTSRPRAATLESRFQLPKLWRRRNQCLPAGSRNNGGVVVPGGIGQMVALQILGVINVNVSNGRHILKELKNLTQLRKLGVSGVKWENCQELCSVISCHAYLESLSVWFDFDNKGMNRASCLDSISSPPLKLQSLKLYGLVDKLPTWIKQVTNLSKLKLQMTIIPQNEIDEVLGSLGKLTTLCLDCFEADELKFSRDFGALQLLEIAINSRLQAVTFHAGPMHNLEVLNLTCHNVPSTLRFSGLEHLRKLKEVSLSGSYDDALKQRLQSQLYKHPREIKPVLKVEPRSS